MNSFYGGQQGKSFSIKRIFNSAAGPAVGSIEQDLLAGRSTPVGVGEFVFISYGTPTSDNYENLKALDNERFQRAFNGSLWQKIYLRMGGLPISSLESILYLKGNELVYNKNDNSFNPNDNTFAYIEISHFQGEVPRIELNKTQILNPDEFPDITLDINDPLYPKLTFSLPRTARFVTGGEGEVDANSQVKQIADKPFVLHSNGDDDDKVIRPGDYYIEDINGFIYLINTISEDKNILTVSYVACLAGIPEYEQDVDNNYSPYEENGEAKPQITIGAVSLDVNKKKVIVKYTSAMTPVYSTNVTSIDPNATATVTTTMNQNDVTFDFHLPRGAKWHVWESNALPTNFNNYGIGDYLLVNSFDETPNDNHGNYYEIIETNNTKILEYKGNLKGSNVTVLNGIMVEITVEDATNYQSIKDAVIDQLEASNNKPANPQSILPVEAIIKVNGEEMNRISFWASYVNEEWFLTQMTALDSSATGLQYIEAELKTDDVLGIHNQGYSISIPGIIELKEGTVIRIICNEKPDWMISDIEKGDLVYLKVNDLSPEGEKSGFDPWYRINYSFNQDWTKYIKTPIELVFRKTIDVYEYYEWQFVSKPLQAIEPIEYGGTGADNIAQAQENLGLAYYRTTSSETDGVFHGHYEVNIPWIRELKIGTIARIITHDLSNNDKPTLNVNQMGAIPIKRYVSDCARIDLATQWTTAWSLDMNIPLELLYDGESWIATSLTQPSANDLADTVPVEHGGTGADTVTGAQENLGLSYVETTDYISSTPGYAAQIPGLTELKPGAIARIIPHAVSEDIVIAGEEIYLKVNDLDPKAIRIRTAGWWLEKLTKSGGFEKGLPVELVYNGEYWVVNSYSRPNGWDFSGILRPQNGGTGEDSIDETPVEDSRRMVTSDGVYRAINYRQTFSDTDLQAGVSELEYGHFYFVYDEEDKTKIKKAYVGGPWPYGNKAILLFSNES